MNPDPSTTTALLAHGRCPVSVVMAHAELSFAELARLQPGSLIELARAPSPHAALYLGASHLADVELVEVDGQLAARVLCLRSGPPQPVAPSPGG